MHRGQKTSLSGAIGLPHCVNRPCIGLRRGQPCRSECRGGGGQPNGRENECQHLTDRKRKSEPGLLIDTALPCDLPCAHCDAICNAYCHATSLPCSPYLRESRQRAPDHMRYRAKGALVLLLMLLRFPRVRPAGRVGGGSGSGSGGTDAIRVLQEGCDQLHRQGACDRGEAYASRCRTV